MAEVLTAMAVATFIKDAMEVWDKIENSFSRVSQNRRGAQRLVREIRNDLILLKELYEDHHATLDESPRTGRAIKNLIENMEQAQGACSELLPPTSEKRFKKYTLKYYAWKNGSKIEEELLDLKSHVSDCRQRFQILAIARVEIGAIEHRQVTCSRIDGIQNMLSDISISTHHLRAYHPAQPGISPSIVIDIPDEYLKCIISAISKTWATQLSSSLPSSIFFLTGPTIQGGNNDLFPRDRESLHRDTVHFALYIQKQIEYARTVYEKSHHIMRLTRMARHLGMTQEADSIDYLKVLPQIVIDQLRPQAWRLAHADGESMVLSSNSEVLQHLHMDMLNHKVDLLFQFFAHHSDAVYQSEDLLAEIGWFSEDIWNFHLRHEILKVEIIQEEVERLKKLGRRIHELDKSLPLLDI